MHGLPWPTQISQVLLVILAPHNTWHCQLSLEDVGFYWTTCISLAGHGWDLPCSSGSASVLWSWVGLVRPTSPLPEGSSCPVSILVPSLFQCSDPAPPQPELELHSESSLFSLFCFRMTMDALQLANTAFAVDMFKKLCEKDKTANIIFAPLCTSTSLALAYKATKGDTADQMKQVSCQHPVLGLQNHMAVRGGFLIHSC